MIFKVSYVLYNLKSIRSAKDRQGAILKITWPDGFTGYSDLHPWPEFGDAPILDQLNNFKKLRLSPLLEQALWLARRDAMARNENRSLFVGANLNNNFLIQNILEFNQSDLIELKKRNFSKLKIKIGHDYTEEAKLIAKIGESGDFGMRLDFGSVPDWMTFERFMGSLGAKTSSRIEYVEDPVKYNADEWREARKIVKIAMDREVSQFKWTKDIRPQADVVILKPARVDVEKIMQFVLHWKMHATITSSLDHAVGVLHAYSVAQELAIKHPLVMLDPGCMTLSEYQRDEYTGAIAVRGPQFLMAGGVGIGLETVLQKETWQSLDSL